ncbi:MAG: hypothetical protein NC489_30080 [Ruminococcus flavefaciens]|nr:hypothetical protein [Ruminococcus flavefaciens]
MEYIVYKRFKGEGLDGPFNLRYGTVCEERDGYLFAPDGRRICAATSENGWGHFRQNTPEGAFRQAMLERLYQHYQRRPECTAEDFDPAKWPEADNTYWKSLLRTMETDRLTEFYRERLGEPPEEV